MLLKAGECCFISSRVAKNLPDPEGPLSDVLPSSTIKAANDAVLATSRQLEQAPKSSKLKRGP